MKQGGSLRINIVSLIASCLLVQLLFGTSKGSEIDNRHLKDRGDFAFICDHERAEVEDIYDKVKDNLVEQGFSVREGRYHAANANAAINNPGNPYLSYFFHDPRGPQAINPVFKLQPGSAVLFVGCTPAKSVYFSWQSYAFIHERAMVFASLGEATNQLVINTTQSGGSWTGSESEDARGKLTAVITTADGTTFSTISTALDEAGAPSGIVNLDPIPSHQVDMVNDPSLDFMLLVRPVIWYDQQEMKNYFSQVGRVIIFDPPSDQEFDPIPPIPDRQKGSGTFEIEQPGISEDLAKLHTNIVASMESESYHLEGNETLRDITTYGYECIEQHTYCRGDSRDAQYLAYTQIQPFKKKDVYVFVGTNSQATGKVSYSNVGLYRNETSRFVATSLSVDNFIMEGSASVFGVNNNKLIAYVFARNCNKIPQFLRDYCFKVGYDEESQVPPKLGWGFGYRTYLDMTTKTAALLDEIVIPQVLKFQLE